MNAPRIELEPARFAMTGGGPWLHLRAGFDYDGEPGQHIDAPAYMPTGGLRRTTHTTSEGLPYVVTSKLREGALC